MNKTAILIFTLLLTACTAGQNTAETAQAGTAQAASAHTQAAQAETQDAAAAQTQAAIPTPTINPCSPEGLAPWWSEIQPVREATIAAAEEFFLGVVRGNDYMEEELQTVQEEANERIEAILALDTPECALGAVNHLREANVGIIAGAINVGIGSDEYFEVALGTYAINIDNLTLQLQALGLLTQ